MQKDNTDRGGGLLHNRYEKIFPGTIAVSCVMMLLGVLLDDPANILPGLYHIVTMQDLLITDYVYIAGVGATLINSGLVTILSILIIKLSGDPFNGFTIVEMGLMAGFSLFGKNVFNIWPIILGTWLYAKYQKEPFAKYASVALLATSLAPMVSYMALGSIHASLPLGILTGIVIGFVLPSLSAYTYKIQNGMNLYNMGFACGLLAMMIVPILTAFGDHPDSALYWAEGYNGTFAIVLGVLCAAAILTGLFATGAPPWAVWAGYRRLLSTTGGRPAIICACSARGLCWSTWASTAFWAWRMSLSWGATSTAPPWGAFSPLWAFPPSVSMPSTSSP